MAEFERKIVKENNSSEEDGLTRRDLLWGGATVTVGALLEQAATNFVWRWASRFFNNFGEKIHLKNKIDEFLDFNDNLENYKCAQQTTKATYTPETVKGNKIIVIGNSIAHGFTDDGYYSESDVMKNDINRMNPSWNWSVKNLAEDGSTTNDAFSQLETIPNYLSEEQNSDITMDVGGNDVAEILFNSNYSEEKINQILSKNQIDLAKEDISYLENLIDALTSNIQVYEDKILLLLGRILDYKVNGLHLNNIVMESLPNIGLSDEVTFISRMENIPTFTIKLDSPFKKQIASILSKRINIAMARAVSRFNVDFPDSINVILIDEFNLLKKEDLDGIHPTKKGQNKMALEHESRSEFIDDNGDPKTLLQMLS